ncbi:SIS domain-containing protein [Solirubrobacter soli]|uniref:SIS domain-containing protein n=1 Tax=Solirubrobacter soli TaxID=363832 RepID=UPI00146EBB05|nr:SIS domain-containing protein [Solirubrobacter soli]
MSPYLNDILDQPRALAAFTSQAAAEIAPVAALGRGERVVLTGMGASLAALRPAWMTLVAAGVPAWLIETAELLNDAPGLLEGDVSVVAASQSGRSVEAVALVDAAPGRLIALTNDALSPLAGGADVTVEIHAGVEHAVSTRSYVNTLAAAQLVGDALAGVRVTRPYEAVADALAGYLASWEDRVAALKSSVGVPERLYLLARGASLAAASCGALIAKEAAKRPVEAMSVPQFRHGPLELADERLTAIVLAGTGPDRERNRRLYEDLERLGAAGLWADADGDLPLADVPADGLPMAEIVLLQLLTVALAELTGVPAGEFRHLEKVTTVE